MDIVGRFHLADGTEVKVVPHGVDDHSRFFICARVVARATARPECAKRSSGRFHSKACGEEILTDNGKVFTAHLGQGPGPVLFDRICANNGIRHLLTAPYSPTTTGKVERFHRTMRSDFFVEHNQGALEHRGAPRRSRRVGRRFQHRASAPIAGRPTTRRTLRLGRCASSSERSRCQRSPTRFRSQAVRRA